MCSFISNKTTINNSTRFLLLKSRKNSFFNGGNGFVTTIFNFKNYVSINIYESAVKNGYYTEWIYL